MLSTGDINYPQSMIFFSRVWSKSLKINEK